MRGERDVLSEHDAIGAGAYHQFDIAGLYNVLQLGIDNGKVFCRHGTPSRFSTMLRPAKMMMAAKASESTICSSASFVSIP